MSGTIEELTEVATFTKIVELGGISAAARWLGVPKSTVSRRLARLEATLETRLLQRTSRQMKLTEEGRGYYQRVAQAVATLEEASSWVADESAGIRGTVRLTAPIDFGRAFLAEVIAEFIAQHPSVRVDVELSNRIVDMVQEGFDLAIRAGQLQDSSLIARALTRTSMWLGAAPKLLERTGPIRRITDLERVPCVTFRATAERVRWRLHGPRGERSVDVQSVVNAEDFSFVGRMVTAGAGVGVMPAYIVDDGVRDGSLIRVLPKWDIRLGRAYIVYPSNRHLPRRVTLLRDWLLERLADIPGRITDG